MYSPIKDHESWWIERGAWFPIGVKEPTYRLRSPLDLGDPSTPFEALGLVHLENHQRTMTITWSLKGADGDSLLEALDFALVSNKRVRLRYFKEAWAGEVHPNGQAATERALRLQSLVNMPLVPSTIIERQSLNNLGRANPILALAKLEARELGNPLAIANRPLGQMGLFFKADREGDLRFLQIGQHSEAAQIFGEVWRLASIGSLCDGALDDSTYDRRVSQPYFEAIHARVPIHDHVLGFMDTGRYKMWLPYQRLLLPYGDSLACFTRVTQSIEIDFLGERIANFCVGQEVRPFGPD